MWLMKVRMIPIQAPAMFSLHEPIVLSSGQRCICAGARCRIDLESNNPPEVPCSSHSRAARIAAPKARAGLDGARSWREGLQLGAQGVELLFEPGILDRAPDEGHSRGPIVVGERAQAFEPLVPDLGEELTVWDCSVARLVEPRAELGDRSGRWWSGRARVAERGSAIGIGGLAADAAL